MLKNHWYIIAITGELKTKKYVVKKLLGISILIGKDSEGKFFAIEDRCCHRNVALSLGEFDGEQFTCGYHGWKYDTSGKCKHIPSLEGKIPEVACIKSFPLRVEYNFIWVSLSENTNTPFDFAELDAQSFIYTQHQFDGDLKFVSESLFDPFHINHVHRNSIKSFMGDLNKDIIDLDFEKNDKSLIGSYKRINNGSFYDKKYFGNEDYIQTHFEFHFPNISKLQICFPKRTLTIYEHIVEIESGKIDMIQITAWDNIFKGIPFFAKWFMKKISNEIVLEDIEFFKSHNVLNANHDFNEVHIKSDQLSIAFRNIWDKQMRQDELV